MSTLPGVKTWEGFSTGLNMKSVEPLEGCGRQSKRRERVKAQQDNSQQVPLVKDPGTYSVSTGYYLGTQVLNISLLVKITLRYFA